MAAKAAAPPKETEPTHQPSINDPQRPPFVPQTIERCAHLARATRAAMEALGLRLFSKRPSNGVTAVSVPAGVDGKQVTKLMYDRSRVMVAGGQGEMAGKLFRFAHMGYISPEDVLAGLAALEPVLVELGHKAVPGAGVNAARAVLEKRAPVEVSR